MKSVSAAPSLLAVALLVAGCDASSEGAPESSAQGGAGSAQSEPLCDGTKRLRFAMTQGGGNLNGVPRVATELGWAFLLIDGTCRYWALSGPTSGVRSGVLTPDEAEQLEEELLLGRWDALSSTPWSCSDDGGRQFRFGGQRYSLACASNSLTQAADEARVRLYASGSPLDGRLRFMLAQREEPFSPATIAVEWPLTSDPESVAVPPGMDETADAAPSLASGVDADALRALREKWNGDHPDGTPGAWLRIPIVSGAGEDARYYNLSLRDVTPFEKDDRLEVAAFFSATP